MAENQKVACLLGDGFEDSEFRVPYDALKKAGFQVDIIGMKDGQEIAGKKGKEKVKSEKAISDVTPEDYAALLIPGGYSPDHLRIDDRFVQFVKRFDGLKRPLAAVCHGPQLLMSANLVRGRTLTAWTTIQGDLRLAGANVRDQEVVIDGSWITSRKPDDVKAFSDALVHALQDPNFLRAHQAHAGAEAQRPRA